MMNAAARKVPVMDDNTRTIRNPYDTFWFSTIWLGFLIIPILLISELSKASLIWDVIAYGCTLLFGAVYLFPIRRYHENATLTAILGWSALLALICLPTVPSLGAAVMAFSPYLSALGLWGLPLRKGLVWGVVLFTVSIIAVFVGYGIAEGLQIMLKMIGVFIGQLFTMIFRVIEYRGVSAERLAREIATVREREEISRDIHDLLGHSLTTISLKAQLAAKLVDSDPERAKRELDELLDVTACSLDEVRGTVGRLRTPDLASQLKSAQTMLETADLEYQIQGNVHDVPVEHRALMAWAIRESVTNLVRHADASEASITIRPNLVRIADNGNGTDAPEGHGLTGLRRRVEEAGAQLELRPLRPGTENPGTCVEVLLP